MGRLERNTRTHTLKAYDCPILIRQIEGKKEDSTELGTDYEHQKAKDYKTESTIPYGK
jgi:hypothetical protein